MGLGRIVRLAICPWVAAMVLEQTALAGVVTLDNGVVGDGHAKVQIDAYGSYGFLVNPTAADDFDPPDAQKSNATYMAGALLFLRAAGDLQHTAVMLTEHQKWIDRVEPPVNSGDGIAGPRLLTRTITTVNMPVAANEARSAFAVAQAAAGLRLDVTLHQIVIANTPTTTSRFEQTYAITNSGTLAVDLVFHVVWDPDLYYSDNSYVNDIVGVGPGHCYVYTRDPGTTTGAVALGDGGSTVPVTHYYAGLLGVVPGSGPAFTVSSSAMQPVWTAGGMPVAWRNHLATIGYDTAGESTMGGDAALGIEYRFSLPSGMTQTLRIHRNYGTISLPCPAAPECGNGVSDPGEQCDTSNVDTVDCVGATCLRSACGDGQINAAAGEDCDSIGIDSTSCNGATCLAPRCGDGYLNLAAGELCDDGPDDTSTCVAVTCQPSLCGDGYVNAAAGEDCDGAAGLCDACTYAFTLGGGCVGCGASSPHGALAGWVIVALLVVRRRRRYTLGRCRSRRNRRA